MRTFTLPYISKESIVRIILSFGIVLLVLRLFLSIVPMGDLSGNGAIAPDEILSKFIDDVERGALDVYDGRGMIARLGVNTSIRNPATGYGIQQVELIACPEVITFVLLYYFDPTKAENLNAFEYYIGQKSDGLLHLLISPYKDHRMVSYTDDLLWTRTGLNSFEYKSVPHNMCDGDDREVDIAIDLLLGTPWTDEEFKEIERYLEEERLKRGPFGKYIGGKDFHMSDLVNNNLVLTLIDLCLLCVLLYLVITVVYTRRKEFQRVRL